MIGIGVVSDGRAGFERALDVSEEFVVYLFRDDAGPQQEQSIIL